MPRAISVPTYRKHKFSGQAIVTFRLPSGKRKDYLLGPYNSPESKVEYARLLKEFQASDGTMSSGAGISQDITVNELLDRYFRFAETHYRHPDGTPTGQAENILHGVRPLIEMYGHRLARDFGPLALRTCRDWMLDRGICRLTVNQRVGMIRQVFRWAVAVQLVPGTLLVELRAVEGLKAGRSRAKDQPSKPHSELKLPRCPTKVRRKG